MLDTEFERIGRRLFAEGLVSGNFGNMSVLGEGGYYITRTASYLDLPGQPVFVPFNGDVPAEASSEYRVHHEIYLKTGCRAVVHAHPVYSVTLSLVRDAVVPADSEGKMVCPVIPVVDGNPGSGELALNIGDACRKGRVVIARGHGTFAAGETLDEAYLLTSATEHSCRILSLLGRL